MKKCILVVFCVLLSATYQAQATTIDFERDITIGYSLIGSFEYDSNLHGTGAIGEGDLNSFSFEGFLNGVSIGGWSLGETLSARSNAFHFNFDTYTLRFVYGGLYPNEPLHVSWGDTTSGLSFIGGSLSTIFLMDGKYITGTNLSSMDGGDQFSATVRTPAPVPEPSTILLLGGGLLGLCWYGRKRKKA